MPQTLLAAEMEHFVTLFDSKFLPQGLSLHQSLASHMQAFHLWVVCMDDLVHEQLIQLKIPNLTPVPVSDLETEALLAVKPGRTRAEYCWTITPFTPELVFSLDSSVKRVTYIDADLMFFNDPNILFGEFELSKKHVMITEHAYAPEYLKFLPTSGRFCVQFMVFDRSIEAQAILSWWKARCLEWCFARLEDGKFGDQKYLDVWPQMFPQDVHILKHSEHTLAPWNVDHLLNQQPPGFKPVFFHFHAFRIVSDHYVKLYEGYRIASSSKYLYHKYVHVLKQQIAMLRSHGIPLPILPEKDDVWTKLRSLVTMWKGFSAKVRI